MSQSDIMKDPLVAAPHSIKTSFIECCGPDFMYTPLYHEQTVHEVIMNV